MRIYLTNLGMYNEGTLHGTWLKLPVSNEEIQTALDTIGIGGRYEEYFITDYENDLGLKVDEYESLSELNEVATCVDSLNPHDKQVLKAVIEMDSSNVSDIVDIIGNLDTYTLNANIKSYHDLGRYLIHESGEFDKYTIETLAPYLDYETYGYTYSCNVEGKLSSYGWLEWCY